MPLVGQDSPRHRQGPRQAGLWRPQELPFRLQLATPSLPEAVSAASSAWQRRAWLQGCSVLSMRRAL